MIFILLFWIILMMVSEVDGEVSSTDIFLVRSKLILIVNCVCKWRVLDLVYQLLIDKDK